MSGKIDFYHEVTIIKSAKCPEFIGRKAIVMGISEDIDEAGNVHFGYSVRVDGYEYSVCFDDGELEPTGKRFKREDFY
ncbi:MULTISPECIES: Imm31 family immunity protein [unclassified Serratia (in: enterobacteria)]|uniref:Imm31 family immunity protein n=1 Tax=unclassified Serratia (in: enterobacteria) TaxID=2647522 RepID=UPI0027F45481|nr:MULTISPECIES: Imm31 family immunity protein [unclassified Serratia (in: enterobacteria)]MDQ7099503.1 Imm31 family immunity protein [Serratia sp. MF2]MDQ7102088.1 Imm31 family immunity protein [Serratia sp. MF1(2023)]